METCQICGSTEALYGSVDLLMTVCHKHLTMFESWCNTHRTSPYSDFLFTV